MATPELMKLKNGSEEYVAAVATTMLILKNLMDSLPGVLAVFDLSEVCKNGYAAANVSQENTDRLVKLRLLDKVDGGFIVHDTVKNIVLSEISGEGIFIELVDPRA